MSKISRVGAVGTWVCREILEIEEMYKAGQYFCDAEARKYWPASSISQIS